MSTTVNENNYFKTHFFDELASTPNLHFPEALSLDQQQSLSKNLKELEQDRRPLEFVSPLHNPLTPESLTVVHTQGSKVGGFQGNTRKYADGRIRPHGGIDIDAEIGQGVLASEDGVVVRAEKSDTYGFIVYVNHRDGYQTRYAHLTDFNVKVGDKIRRGELVGTSGKTGNANSPSIKPHIHFEIRKLNVPVTSMAKSLENHNSDPLDPLAFLIKPKLKLESEPRNWGIKI